MSLPTIKDQVTDGLSRLISFWADKPIVQGLLQSYLDNLQLVEDTYFQLLNDRGVYTSVGEQLDVLGLIVGELRAGREDPCYRQAILTRISLNNSDGTPEVILGLLTAITLTPQPHIWEHYPANIHAFVDRNATNDAAATLDEISPAGVSSRLMFDRLGNSFRGADVVGDSFDLELENLDLLDVDDGLEVANLGVIAAVVVPRGGNSYLPDLLNIQVINPLCEVIDNRRFNIDTGELTFENADNIGLDNGDILGYQIVEEV